MKFVTREDLELLIEILEDWECMAEATAILDDEELSLGLDEDESIEDFRRQMSRKMEFCAELLDGRKHLMTNQTIN
jgi:hypothetical protein